MNASVPTVDALSALPKSRGEATAVAASHYFTGQPCHLGHLEKRNTKSGKCMECVRVHTRNRQANDPAYREMQKRLGKAKTKRIQSTPELKVKVLTQKRAAYAEQMTDFAFVEKRRAKQREYWASAHHVRERKKVTHGLYVRRTDVVARRREQQRLIYQLRLKHDPLHIAKRKQRSSEWAKVNKDRANAKTALRRAARNRAVPIWVTEDEKDIMRLMYAVARRVSNDTGISHEIDHVYPLTSDRVCGLHCPANLQLLTTTQNRAKHNRFAEELL